MNDTQRLVFKIARECVIARQQPVITVPRCAMPLLADALLEGLHSPNAITTTLEGPCNELMFAGVKFKVEAK